VAEKDFLPGRQNQENEMAKIKLTCFFSHKQGKGQKFGQ
jgi:hypothetical protein